MLAQHQPSMLCSNNDASSTTNDPPQKVPFFRDLASAARPALGAMLAVNYLYQPSRYMTLGGFFMSSFVFATAANSANDYMDYEHDMADPTREVTWYRGRVSSKSRLLSIYTGSMLSILIYALYFDPAMLIFYLMAECIEMFLYNGMLFTIPLVYPSPAKCIGFPLDILLNTKGMLFPTMVAQRSWTPPLELVASISIFCIYAELKDYNYEKDTQVRTTATVLGLTASKALLVAHTPILAWANRAFVPFALYCTGKMLCPMALKRVVPLQIHIVYVLNLGFVLAWQYLSYFSSTNDNNPHDYPVFPDPPFPQENEMTLTNVLIWAGTNSDWTMLRIYGHICLWSTLLGLILYYSGRTPLTR